jgi:hypothetical protein
MIFCFSLTINNKKVAVNKPSYRKLEYAEYQVLNKFQSVEKNQ